MLTYYALVKKREGTGVLRFLCESLRRNHLHIVYLDLKIGVEMSFVLLRTFLFECNKRKYSLAECAFTGFHTVFLEMSPVTLERSKKLILARKY